MPTSLPRCSTKNDAIGFQVTSVSAYYLTENEPAWRKSRGATEGQSRTHEAAGVLGCNDTRLRALLVVVRSDEIGIAQQLARAEITRRAIRHVCSS